MLIGRGIISFDSEFPPYIKECYDVIEYRPT